jgi:hypothetical protein
MYEDGKQCQLTPDDTRMNNTKAAIDMRAAILKKC